MLKERVTELGIIASVARSWSVEPAKMVVCAERAAMNIPVTDRTGG